MKHANIVGLDDLKLTEITTATANQATATIAGHALDRARLGVCSDRSRPLQGDRSELLCGASTPTAATLLR